MNDNEVKDQVIEDVTTSNEGETKEAKQVEATPENPAPVAEKEEPIKAESNDALATRKFAEGAKTKEKEILSILGVASVDEAKQLIQTAREQDTNYKLLAAKSICVDLDVKKEFREDVIDIVKGKGLEITEENVKAILSKHPEWVLNADESGSPVIEIGKAGGKGQPESINQKENAKKLFR